MIQALERAVTQFLKLKAEAGSDELLIVAQSMPVSLCCECGWLGHGHLNCIDSEMRLQQEQIWHAVVICCYSFSQATLNIYLIA